ncbi:MAG: outer membrane lipoprotein carrier protein LolA [Zetaproteobacteria bacterium]|nr:MAG: outer membrane lipoprotein carrier protein LolA [Zetaproteobacteria bacterium]
MVRAQGARVRLLLFAMLACGSLQAAAAPLPGPLRQALDRLNRMEGFSAAFTQTLSYRDGSVERYRGRLAVRRPGMFRWHYSFPYEQLYVSDGKAIWHYEPDLLQAERLSRLQAVDSVAMALLDGRIKPDEVALLSSSPAPDGSMRAFTIRIRGGMVVTLTLDRRGRVAAVEQRDELGNRNRILLSEVVERAPDRARFRFTPPRGVDVITEGE